MKQFFIDTAERAVKTMAQTALGILGAGTLLGEVDWAFLLSAAGAAGLASVLSSVASYNFGDKGTASVIKNKEEN